VAKVWALFPRTAITTSLFGWGSHVLTFDQLRQLLTCIERERLQTALAIHPLACSPPPNAPTGAIRIFTISSVPRALHHNPKAAPEPRLIHEHRPTPARHSQVDQLLVHTTTPYRLHHRPDLLVYTRSDVPRLCSTLFLTFSAPLISLPPCTSPPSLTAGSIPAFHPNGPLLFLAVPSTPLPPPRERVRHSPDDRQDSVQHRQQQYTQARQHPIAHPRFFRQKIPPPK